MAVYAASCFANPADKELIARDSSDPVEDQRAPGQAGWTWVGRSCFVFGLTIEVPVDDTLITSQDVRNRRSFVRY
jgi:hypothetical protein